MWTPLLLTLDIGGGRGNACEREEVLTSVIIIIIIGLKSVSASKDVIGDLRIAEAPSDK